MTEMVHKVTLSSGKVILLRDMKIEFQELAAKAAAPRSGGDAMVLSVAMQKELLKILLVSIDGKQLSGMEKEKLDTVLTYTEYMQCLKVIQKIMGDEGNEPTMELVSSGV